MWKSHFPKHFPFFQAKIIIFDFSHAVGIGHSGIAQGTRASLNNQSIIWYHYIKDHVDSGHLTKFDAFRVTRDQVMDLETWLQIHRKVSNVETVSLKTI